MFDLEHGIALHPMEENQDSSRGEEKSPGFSRVVAVTWGIFSS